MKGFKPTGYGPSTGFKFPASYGFTGSTGAYTNVQPYVRQKPRAFKDGGYVSGPMADTGSALVRRARPYTNEDQQSGGRSPLRPGFKKGGKTHKANGGPVMSASPLSTIKRMRRKPPRPPSASTMKEKFAADGGRVYGSSSKGFASDVRKTGEFIGQIPRMLTEAARGAMRSTQQDVADTKRRRIDRIADGTASNYACGGKVAKRQMGGPAMGYAPMASRMVSAMPQMPTRAAMPMRGTMMRSKGGMSRYEKGGAVSDEAQDRKMIGTALRKHVASPAPGHKGLGKMCK